MTAGEGVEITASVGTSILTGVLVLEIVGSGITVTDSVGVEVAKAGDPKVALVVLV
jgi:hypothetical protein